MRRGVVYVITGPEGLYVGFTVQPLRRRLKGHLSSARCGEPWFLSDAIRKHGADAFTIEAYASVANSFHGPSVELEVIEQFKADGARLYNMDRVVSLCGLHPSKRRAYLNGLRDMPALEHA